MPGPLPTGGGGMGPGMQGVAGSYTGYGGYGNGPGGPGMGMNSHRSNLSYDFVSVLCRGSGGVARRGAETPRVFSLRSLPA